jgi:hypothetical protein
VSVLVRLEARPVAKVSERRPTAQPTLKKVASTSHGGLPTMLT